MRIISLDCFQCTCMALVASAVFASSVAAQRAPWTDPDDPAGCTAKLPLSGMARVAIYASQVVAIPSDTIQAAIARSYAEEVTAGVAAQVRRMLGATAREIPEGDSVVSWRGARTSFRVTVQRGGGLTWTAVHPDSLTPARQGDALLARALAVYRDSMPPLTWPRGIRGSTIAFDIVLDGIRFDRNEVPFAPEMHAPQPLFSVMQPWMEPAREVHRRPVSYPMRSSDNLAGGLMFLRFQVDTTGRVDMKSVHDVWPEDHPRPRGDLGDFYRAFVAAVRRSLDDATFTPARIGGCAVKSWVIEGHNFTIIYRR